LAAILPRRKRCNRTHFGTQIVDPYRWLESDGRSTPEVAAWMVAQDKLTRT
jgi:protease II